MAYNHADILSGSPYYDDFNDTEKFLRILFKPDILFKPENLPNYRHYFKIKFPSLEVMFSRMEVLFLVE